jgi:hypothetical protein
MMSDARTPFDANGGGTTSSDAAEDRDADSAMTASDGAIDAGDIDAGDPDAGIADASVDGPSATFCEPFDTQSCYDGEPSTEGIGPCHEGTQTCSADGSAWGACTGQVVPVQEICGNLVDDDCNDLIDESPDFDGDGWGRCHGDCCDLESECSDPELVNPGAYEILSNGLDDDCDLATSDSSAPDFCSTVPDFSTVTAAQMAEAMDLCQTTTANPALAQKKWGLISAQQLNADGSSPVTLRLADIQDWQSAVLTAYGTAISPQSGSTMVGMSTGRMRDTDDAGYAAPNVGTDFASDGSPPAVYLAAHSGVLPSSIGCSGTCPTGSGANDSVNLRLTIRVPTNVQGFRYKYRFFSSEYWSYSCSTFNDFSLALLTTIASGIPADRNIAFDTINNPVSVNNGFFEACQAKGCYTCPLGVGPLAGTGMELDDPLGGAGTQATGGGTDWLVVQAPVLPGETMVLDLMVFDVGDNTLDSVLLLDQFEWVP